MRNDSKIDLDGAQTMRIPFFHYTCLDNLPGILKDGRVASRYWLAKNGKEITDISIDPKQPVRKKLRLLPYIPLFPGFYSLRRGSELNAYLMQKYDDPKVQNPSFYGSLNKVLQIRMGEKYNSVIILLVNDELIYNFADHGRVRFFNGIAVKPNVRELPIGNRTELQDSLRRCISDSNIFGEIDLLDDGTISIACTSDIEALIVDSDEVKKQVVTYAHSHGYEKLPQLFVSKLPRDNPFEDPFDL